MPLALALTARLRAGPAPAPDPALLALTGLAGVCQVAPCVLEASGGFRQVAVRVDRCLGAAQRLAQTVERGPGPGRIALGETLRGIAQRRRRPAVRPGGRRLHLGELAGQVLELFGRHAVQVVAELVEVVLGLARVAVAVGVLAAGRRTGQRSRQ